MYSHVRFLAAASLIGFGGIIGVGTLVLIPPAVERLLVAKAQISRPSAVLAQGTSHAVTVEVPAAPEPPSAKDEHPATAPQEMARPQELAPQQELARPQEPARQQESAPQQEPARQKEPARQSDTVARQRGKPVPPTGAEQRHVARPAIEPQVRRPVASTAIRRDRNKAAKKRSTKEALTVVRRFGDTLQDIPVTAYAPDGRQRRIVIRPTSVQDVYYYSVPR